MGSTKKWYEVLPDLEKPISGYIEKTLMPESANNFVQKTPIVNDMASRGWMGSTPQRMSGQEGENAYNNSSTTKGLKITGTILAMIAGTYFGGAMGGGNLAASNGPRAGGYAANAGQFGPIGTGTAKGSASASAGSIGGGGISPSTWSRLGNMLSSNNSGGGGSGSKIDTKAQEELLRFFLQQSKQMRTIPRT